MKFRPLHDRVVIERIDAEAKTAGGIIIPDTAQEKPQQGKVIAVGPGGRDESGKLIPIDVEGRRPHPVRQMVGTEVKIDGVEYLIMKESDIMGVLVEARRPRRRPPDHALSEDAMIAVDSKAEKTSINNPHRRGSPNGRFSK